MLNELPVGEFLAALGERTPAPASGSATALTAALAAALAELAARFAGEDEAAARSQSIARRLVELDGGSIELRAASTGGVDAVVRYPARRG